MAMHPKLALALANQNALKIISGLNNFDTDHVCQIARAAEVGGATFIDIAVKPELVTAVRKITKLPICVSAVEPELFVPAVKAGADLIEIGNFDSFYGQGIRFEAEEILDLTKKTRSFLPNITLCVTVPHILPLDEQVDLAQSLERMGANIIQTEGGTSTKPKSPGVIGLIEKATATLAAAHSISRAVNIPVLCASGLSSVTTPMAIAAGASGVGVGSAINQLNDSVAMIAAVRSLVESLAVSTTASSLAS